MALKIKNREEAIAVLRDMIQRKKEMEQQVQEDPMPFKLFCSSFDPIFFLFLYVRHHLAILRAKMSKAKKSLGQEM